MPKANLAAYGTKRNKTLGTAVKTMFQYLAAESTVEAHFTTRGASSGVDLQVPCGAWSGGTAMAAAHTRAACP